MKINFSSASILKLIVACCEELCDPRASAMLHRRHLLTSYHVPFGGQPDQAMLAGHSIRQHVVTVIAGC